MELPSVLHEFIGDKGQPTKEQAEEVFRLLEKAKYNKKDLILPVGGICRDIFIVKKGVVKSSFKDENGEMHVMRFHSEGEVFSSLFSFIHKVPSDLQIECLERCEILKFRHEDFIYMGKVYPGLSTALNKTLLKSFHNELLGKSQMIVHDASSRYKAFKAKFSAIERRLPLKDVASYLGIRQQSLSRLRSALKQETES